jgi:chloride channel protein, CIC family
MYPTAAGAGRTIAGSMARQPQGADICGEWRNPPASCRFSSASVTFVGAMLRPARAGLVTRKREFWVLMGYAVALGVFGAFAGLVSLGAIKFGGRWGADSRAGWFDGHWWWVAVTAAAGVVVGLLRRLTHLPEEVPGLFDDLQAEHFDAGLVRGTIAVSAVSLIGGASVGPEKVLASMGAGVGSRMAQRRGHHADGHLRTAGKRGQ